VDTDSTATSLRKTNKEIKFLLKSSSQFKKMLIDDEKRSRSVKNSDIQILQGNLNDLFDMKRVDNNKIYDSSNFKDDLNQKLIID
jgi:hypothetical protein